MNLAFSSNAFVRYTLLETIRLLAETGYRGIEIMADVPHAYPPNLGPSEVGEIRSALERYRMAAGRLPETLEPLAPKFIDRIPNDVIDGKPLRYHLEAGGSYVLYSVGWNQRDDGGQLAPAGGNKERRIDFTRGDWVWQMPK